MKRIWMVRHGESRAQTGEDTGEDPGLCPNGVGQAKKLRKVLPEVSFDKIFVSPLKRARETFENSGMNREKVVFDSRLVEVGGYSEILPYDTGVTYGSPDVHDAWNVEASRRLADFLATLRAAKGPDILVVSHVMALSCLANIALSPEAGVVKTYNYFMNNAAISQLWLAESVGEFDRLNFWNYRGHIDGENFIMK